MARTAQLLSIVIPVYGEGGHIAQSLGIIRAKLLALSTPFELVLVDDGSKDDTWARLEELKTAVPELRAFSLSRNFGKEAAIFAGLEKSRGDAVIVMDSDLQHPPAMISDMFALWRDQGYDVVNAVKRRRGDEGTVRGLMSRLYYRLFEALAGTRMEGSADFKLIDRSVVKAYCDLPERNLFFRGLVTWMGYRQVDLPFAVEARTGGGTKWSLRKLLALALNSISAFSTVPLQFVTTIGGLFLIFAVGLGLQTLYLKFAGGAEEGFPTVILVLLISSSVLMIALGIIGQYLARIYDEVKRRPRYLLHKSTDSDS